MKRILLLLIFVFSMGMVAQPLALDNSFHFADFGIMPIVNKIIVIPNGKLLVWGNFSANGFVKSHVALLNPDGSFDANFDITSGGPDGFVNDACFDSSGRIYLVGDFTHYNGNTRKGIVRLLPNGSVDPGFNPASQLANGQEPNLSAVGIRQDGMVFVCGTYSNSVSSHVVSFNMDGTPNTLFTTVSLGISWVNQMVFQPDNKILVVGTTGDYNKLILRINPNGGVDNEFTLSNDLAGSGTSLFLQSNGKILIGGQWKKSVADTDRFCLLRLNGDGSLDDSFISEGYPLDSPYFPFVKSIGLIDGNYMINGYITNYLGSSYNGIICLNETGNPVPWFSLGDGFNIIPQDVKIYGTSLFVGGSFNLYNSEEVHTVAKINLPTLGINANMNDNRVRILSETNSFRVLQSNEHIIKLDVFDAAGRRIANLISPSGNSDLVIDKLPAGLYFCHITTNRGFVTEKVIVK